MSILGVGNSYDGPHSALEKPAVVFEEDGTLNQKIGKVRSYEGWEDQSRSVIDRGTNKETKF